LGMLLQTNDMITACKMSVSTQTFIRPSSVQSRQRVQVYSLVYANLKRLVATATITEHHYIPSAGMLKAKPAGAVCPKV
jgi:hypothetical protein